MRIKEVDFDLVSHLMHAMATGRHWLSDGMKEVEGVAERFELCGVGIRVILKNGKKVILRIAKHNAEFLNSVSVFATKENA